jgi:hypothetical protein
MLATKTTPHANDIEQPVNYKPDQFAAPLGAQLPKVA